MADINGKTMKAPSPKGDSTNGQVTPGHTDNADYATPQAKAAGHGHSHGQVNSPMGGHNVDAKNQYTAKPKRGSSL